MSRKQNPQTLDIKWGSSEESQQIVDFIINLEGLEDPTAVHAGALALLYARHVSKVRPALMGAIRALTKPGRPIKDLFHEISGLDLSDLNRTSQSFMKSTARIMLLGNPVDTRRAVDNAVSLMYREYQRREILADGIENTMEEDDDVTVAPVEKAAEATHTPVAQKPVEEVVPTPADQKVAHQEPSEPVSEGEPQQEVDQEDEQDRAIVLAEDDFAGDELGEKISLDSVIEDDVVVVAHTSEERIVSEKLVEAAPAEPVAPAPAAEAAPAPKRRLFGSKSA